MLSELELAERHVLWDQFLERWPIETLRSMTLEEYTNLEKDDAFVYWMEARTVELGSIWGMSAFKWGIYRRADTETKESNATHTFGDQYAWWTKRGATAEEAFASVRDSVVAVAEAARTGDLDAIDVIDLTALYKWKLAFLYQDRENPTLFPIYANKALFWLYQRFVDASAKLHSTPYSVRYATLRDRFASITDPIQLGYHLWALFERSQTEENPSTRYWGLCLDHIGGASIADGILSASEVPADEVPLIIVLWFSAEDDVFEGDRLAFVYGGRVRARGSVGATGEGEISWVGMSRCDVPWSGPTGPGLHRVGNAATIERIWGAGAAPPAPEPRSEPTRPGVSPPSRNIVLYGPPGTGKTYATTRRALQLILGEEVVRPMTDETAAKQFRQLQQEGRVELVTFHQAYGYEEFVEGLRPVLEDVAGGDVRYEVHSGIFKRIALRAAAAGLRTRAEEPTFETLWTELLARVKADEDQIRESVSGREYVLRVSANENFESLAVRRDQDELVVTERRQIASKRLVGIWWQHREELGAPEGITYEQTRELLRRVHGGEGGHHFTAIWLVYRELLGLRDELVAARVSSRPTLAQVQEALDRPSPGRVDFEFTATAPQFVLVVDEINRGNISKILGELITLLEPDKRLGMANELKLPLTYSPGRRFAVPPNLHVLGTMNTADRSIALMDVALRRRFEFEEVMPNSEVLRSVLARRVDDEAFVSLVVDLFEVLNARIRFLYDRDHQLGHAYFMEATGYDALRRVLTDRIVPLLQEYFYGSWDKIAAVLGCPYDESGRPARGGAVVESGRYVAPIVTAEVLSERTILGFDHDEYEDAVDYVVSADLLSANGQQAVLPYLLGVLDLTGEQRAARRRALEAGAAFASVRV